MIEGKILKQVSRKDSFPPSGLLTPEEQRLVRETRGSIPGNIESVLRKALAPKTMEKVARQGELTSDGKRMIKDSLRRTNGKYFFENGVLDEEARLRGWRAGSDQENLAQEKVRENIARIIQEARAVRGGEDSNLLRMQNPSNEELGALRSLIKKVFGDVRISTRSMRELSKEAPFSEKAGQEQEEYLQETRQRDKREKQKMIELREAINKLVFGENIKAKHQEEERLKESLARTNGRVMFEIEALDKIYREKIGKCPSFGSNNSAYIECAANVRRAMVRTISKLRADGTLHRLEEVGLRNIVEGEIADPKPLSKEGPELEGV